MAKRAKASAKKRVKPIVRDGARAIDFYKDALGAVEKVRMIGPDGRSVMHTENVSPKELGRRAQAAMAQMPGTSS